MTSVMRNGRSSAGGMRPVQVDVRSPPETGWTRTKTSTQTHTRTTNGDVNRKGGLLITRKDATLDRMASTPSVFDTLPRNVHGGTLGSRSNMEMRMSNPTLSRSSNTLHSVSHSNLMPPPDYTGGYDITRESYMRSQEHNGGQPVPRSRRTLKRRVEGNVHMEDHPTGLVPGRWAYADDNFSVVSEPVAAPRRRAESIGRSGGGTPYNGAPYNGAPKFAPSPFHSTRSITDLHNYDGRPSSAMNGGRLSSLGGMSNGLGGSRSQLAPASPFLPPSEIAAVDPELTEAEKDGNRYHISMNLNAAMLRPGVSTMNRDVDQMDTYTLNSQVGSRQPSRLDFVKDSLDRYPGSRLDVVNYDTSMIQDRPGSRAVSVLHVTGEPEYLLSRPTSAMQTVGYTSSSFQAPQDDGYVIKSVTASKSRLVSQMSSSYIVDVRGQQPTPRPSVVATEEKVEFDLELFGGTRKKVIESSETIETMNTMRRNHSSMEDVLDGGAKPRYTMKLNESLLMDYLPNGNNANKPPSSASDDDNRHTPDARRPSADNQNRRQREAEEARRQREADLEADRREAELRDAARREAELRDAARREAELRDAARREAERWEDERKEAERRDAERREADRKRLEMERAQLQQDIEEQQWALEQERQDMEDEKQRQKEADAERRRREKELEQQRRNLLQEEAERKRERERDEEKERDLLQRQAEELERQKRELEQEKLELVRQRKREEREREELERQKEDLERQRLRDEQKQKEQEKERLRQEQERERQRKEDEMQRERQRKEAEMERERQRKEAEKEKERQRREEEKEKQRRKKKKVPTATLR